MSLVQRCPYFRVSFKRGSTVYLNLGCTLELNLMSRLLVSPYDSGGGGGGGGGQKGPGCVLQTTVLILLSDMQLGVPAFSHTGSEMGER